MKLEVSLFVLVNVLAGVHSTSLASELRTANICAGSRKTISCSRESSSHMVFVTQTYYGIQSDTSGECGYTENDCIKEITLNTCKIGSSECNLFADSRKLNTCSNKRANYLHIKYYCVPYEISGQNEKDICSTNTIQSDKGIIVSPGYPVATANSDCGVTIDVEQGKSINVWVLDIGLSPRNSEQKCTKDYLEIIDITDPINKICSFERESYYDTFCSNRIYINYKTGSSVSSSSKGFKLYYEKFDTASLNCPTGPNTTPSPQGSTLQPITTAKPPLTNIKASGMYNFQICQGEISKRIDAPPYMVISIHKLIYGVPSSLNCEAHTPSHCNVPADIHCNLQKTCTFAPPTDQKLSACSYSEALYIYGEYRFIPIDSTNKYSIGDSNNIDLDNNPYGLITSENYPNWQKEVIHHRSLVSRNPNKGIKFYLTDIDIKDSNYLTKECDEFEYLMLDDKLGNTEQYCGVILQRNTYEYVTCSNRLDLNYSTSAVSGLSHSYRGFKAYYELVDLPDTCENRPTTIPPPTTTYVPPTRPINEEIFSSVLATDQQNGIRTCAFPFKYNGKTYETCIKDDSNGEYWCSIVPDYTDISQKARCNQGLTANVVFDVCAGRQQPMTCPDGYVIFLVSSTKIVTSDGSCDSSKADCFLGDTSSQKTNCNGKKTCTINAFSYSIIKCQNRKINLYQVDYKCLPDKVAYIPTKEFCQTDVILTADSGIIQTPDYPSPQKNLNCQLNYKAPGNRRRLIRIYAVSISMYYSWFSSCKDAYYTISGGKRLCGRTKGELLMQFCDDKFDVNVVLEGNKEYNGIKLYYEVSDITNEILCGQPLTSTSTLGPTVSKTTRDPALPTTSAPSTYTTKLPDPEYVQQGIASETINIAVCDTYKEIRCPKKYGISIRSALYGYSKDGNCFYDSHDCTSYSEVTGVSNCNGREFCTVPFSSTILENCNNVESNYISIDYDCVPDIEDTPKSICDGPFYKSKDVIRSPGWPEFGENKSCSAKIFVNANKIIKAYIIDLNIDDNCEKDSLTLTDTFYSPRKFCGRLTSSFAIETCTNELKVDVVLGYNPYKQKTGTAIYYEAVDKPINLNCPTTTTIPPSTTPITTKTIPPKTTTTPSYNGFESHLFSVTSCGSNAYLFCPDNYVNIIESSVYGVKNSASTGCQQNPNDCFAPYDSAFDYCSGLNKCTLNDFKANSTRVPGCNNQLADYIYVTHKCVPVLNAGNPPQENSELCKNNEDQDELPRNAASIYQSENYPRYPNRGLTVCNRTIRTTEGSFLNVYLTDFSLQPDSDFNIQECHKHKDNYVIISDGFKAQKFCKSQRARLIMETKSNFVNIYFNLKQQGIIDSSYKGFQLFIQSFSVDRTTQPGFSTKAPVTIPVSRPGFISPDYHAHACFGTAIKLQCPTDYGLIIAKEELIDSKGNGCSHPEAPLKECKDPTNILQTQCNMKQKCDFFFSKTEMKGCSAEYADFLHFDYNCVPRIPSQFVKNYTCGGDAIADAQNGILRQVEYPKYKVGVECEQKIVPPVDHGVKFYILDLALSSGANCSDFLKIDDVEFCGTKLAQFAYQTINSDSITIKYKSDKFNFGSYEAQSRYALRGFSIYFEAYSLTEQPSSTRPSTTTTVFKYNEVRNRGETDTLTAVSFLVGIPMFVLIVLIMLVLYKMHGRHGAQSDMRIKYSNDGGPGSINDDIQSFANPLSN